MKDTLHLPLKAKWYDMIEAGVKPEEYRIIKPYWSRRLCFTKRDEGCIGGDCTRCFTTYMCWPYERVCFSYGYTKRRMTWEIASIHIGIGNPAWGAPKDEDVFIIKLGKRIK